MCARGTNAATIARSIGSPAPTVGAPARPGPEGGCTPMRAYELMVIFESGLDDLVIDDQVKSVTAQIATRGGTVASTDRWGRRRFAYEIDHKTEGYYVVWELTSDGGDLEALERSLRLADEVVRHKLVRLPDREAARRGLLGDGQAEPAAAG